MTRSHAARVSTSRASCFCTFPTAAARSGSMPIHRSRSGENPVAPVFVDGAKTVTLKGERIAEEFQEIVERYVARRYVRSAAARPAPSDQE